PGNLFLGALPPVAGADDALTEIKRECGHACLYTSRRSIPHYYLKCSRWHLIAQTDAARFYDLIVP
ncbi:MAG: hypothetical protein QE570_06325, partial [Verrucomicrobiota bacterium]|nr:hypothetical protein [Verrucomicrobiota bacterium]